jgi:hypothetical protein
MNFFFCAQMDLEDFPSILCNAKTDYNNINYFLFKDCAMISSRWELCHNGSVSLSQKEFVSVESN